MTEQTYLVAFVVDAESREVGHHVLGMRLAEADLTSRGFDSWWVAEDDRRDNSDNDSAVFVRPGRQVLAHRVLAFFGLTDHWNFPGSDGTTQEVTALPEVTRSLGIRGRAAKLLALPKSATDRSK